MCGVMKELLRVLWKKCLVLLNLSGFQLLTYCVFSCSAKEGFVSYTYLISCEVVAVMTFPVLILMFLCTRCLGGTVGFYLLVHRDFP